MRASVAWQTRGIGDDKETLVSPNIDYCCWESQLDVQD
jgi:hypothetical protein